MNEKEIPKMKIFRNLFIILCVCVFISPEALKAKENGTYITYLADGSYYKTSLIDTTDHIRCSTKTGVKITGYYNSNGKLLWQVSVTGTFNYNGSSSTCTKATVSAKSFVSNWKISNQSSSKSGNKATGTATAKAYYNGTLINTVKKSVILTCSSSGKLS